MEKFAKIFETEKHGQILVMMDTDKESRPQIKFIYIPTGPGICSTAIGFDDTDTSWNEVKKVFNKFDTEEKVVLFVRPIIEMMNKNHTVTAPCGSAK